MRLNLMTSLQLVSLRSGVTHSVIIRKRNVHTPVSWVISLTGLGPRLPIAPFAKSKMNGIRHARNTQAVSNRRFNRFSMKLEILFQVHSRIHRGDLIAISVEYQRLALKEFANPALCRLTPARMIHCRVHICVETVLARCSFYPGCNGLFLDKAYLRDRFNAFEAVFPWSY